MTAPGNDRISINRSDLLRLVDTLEAANLGPAAPEAFVAGFMACAQVVREVAARMPDGCVLVRQEDTA